MTHSYLRDATFMGWLRLAGSIKLQVSFAKEPYERDDILQKRPIIRSLLIVATPHGMAWLWLIGSLLYVSFAEYHLFYRALLQKTWAWLWLVGSIKL